MPGSGEYPAVQKLILDSVDKLERNLGGLQKVLRGLEREVVETRSELKALRENYKRLEKERSDQSSKRLALDKMDREAHGALTDRVIQIESSHKRTLGIGAGVGAGAGGGIYAVIEVVKAMMS